MSTSGAAAVEVVVVDPFHVFLLPGDRHRHTRVSYVGDCFSPG